MNSQRVIYAIEIPPKFQADILAGRQPSSMSTAAAQAFNGMTYIQNVIMNYVTDFISGREGLTAAPLKMVTQVKFNPNLTSSWFTSVMGIVSNLTMITVMLTGAALIREREQGTVEHLLVMPVGPTEIMLSKILANGVVIVVSTAISLALVVEWWLQVPVAGSRLLFLGGACVYVFTVAALGIALGTIASTMAQFGLLSIPVLLVMMLLSGSTTPLESMPVWLKYVMLVISPTPHFVIFAQDVLYRGRTLRSSGRKLPLLLLLAAFFLVLRCTAFAASSSAAELRGQAARASHAFLRQSAGVGRRAVTATSAPRPRNA